MAYNLLDLRRRVRRNLKDNSFNAQDIDDALNDTQIEIANLGFWVWLGKTVSGSLIVDEYTYEQQDDHQTTLGLILIHPTTLTTFYNVSKNYIPPDLFFERFPTVDEYSSGAGYNWTEYGNQIYFDRPSDLAYTLRQRYQRLPTDIELDADTPDFPRDFREALVLGAQYRCEKKRDNFDFSVIIQTDFEDKVGDLIERYANRQMVVPETIILGRRNRVDDDTPRLR